MTASQTKDPLRHRLYFRLMDICLFFAALALIDWIVDPYTLDNAPMWYEGLAAVGLIFTSQYKLDCNKVGSPVC